MITLCVSSAKLVNMLSFVHRSKSAIRHMNNNGDSLDPCGTPVFMSLVFYISPATVTNCFLFFKYDSIHFKAFASNPYTFNFATNILWSAKSNAELRSYMIKRIYFLSCFASSRMSKSVSNSDTVLLPFLKPNWKDPKRLFFSKKSSICIAIIFSRTIPATDKSDTGL